MMDEKANNMDHEKTLLGVRPALKYKKVIRSKSTATPMASVTYDKKI